jgi:hypothetical protein
MTVRMDDNTSKQLAKDLRTDVQRTTTNISTGGVEKLLSRGFSFLLLPKNKKN